MQLRVLELREEVLRARVALPLPARPSICRRRSSWRRPCRGRCAGRPNAGLLARRPLSSDGDVAAPALRARPCEDRATDDRQAGTDRQRCSRCVESTVVMSLCSERARLQLELRIAERAHLRQVEAFEFGLGRDALADHRVDRQVHHEAERRRRTPSSVAHADQLRHQLAGVAVEQARSPSRSRRSRSRRSCWCRRRTGPPRSRPTGRWRRAPRSRPPDRPPSCLRSTNSTDRQTSTPAIRPMITDAHRVDEAARRGDGHQPGQQPVAGSWRRPACRSASTCRASRRSCPPCRPAWC